MADRTSRASVEVGRTVIEFTSVGGVDLFRCESILLRSHSFMVVMDVFTRRIIVFGVEPSCIDGVSVCWLFNYTIAGQSKGSNAWHVLQRQTATTCTHWPP